MSTRVPRRVALITLGCARNEVDSEELAARLATEGFELVDEAADADAVVVNTCGFVDAAKKDSIDALLAADDLRAPSGAAGDDAAAADGAAGPRAVVAVGCLAERYGRDLAESLPEADAVLGFDAYPSIGEHLRAVLSGAAVPAHAPRDRRTLLPITPVERGAAAGGHAGAGVHIPGHGAAPAAAPSSGPGPGSVAGASPVRRRLTTGPVAPLKISSGCDRRCAFCAIPSFRGSHVSRPADDVLAEAEWLAGQGVRELVLVSENSTSYGKDLGDLRALEKLLPRLAAVPGIVRVRTVYLQPAELRPSLLEALLTTPGLAPYLDLSFQHASPDVLRRMRRFGGAEHFLDLLRRGRRLLPDLGARSNVIVGFPGETAADLDILADFLVGADLDAIGVFAYSDEEGTEAVGLPGKLDEEEVERRRARITDLAEQLTAARAEQRIGSRVQVLVEEVAGGLAHGHAGHQQPDADGACVVRLGPAARAEIGDLVEARVVATEGVDLIAEFTAVLDRAPRPVAGLAEPTSSPPPAAATSAPSPRGVGRVLSALPAGRGAART
ncbi:Ribosomal protein S12 methylthiotransferase RimO [Frankia canadensis]|uniref:Ribosomal protein uS12 methylthiotransferase RimO n=1 Tax=Frankia canadensis TaxID=1836972 RepID=A0A2I2KTV4_9ACTN|nr:30S ribosomal protein S12 methylthiotransferase RimO [Frankia canadensis]SNQ49080.1 Ribosomal protein S12 methylthiotransferase RimO [Frankia canadensis]SOU56370.1 Ribosomal protein S12 methylthiotransferase RimO [Frankia canadensis]